MAPKTVASVLTSTALSTNDGRKPAKSSKNCVRLTYSEAAAGATQRACPSPLDNCSLSPSVHSEISAGGQVDHGIVAMNRMWLYPIDREASCFIESACQLVCSRRS